MFAKHLRAALAADPEVGTGNVLVKLREHGADPGGPGITFDVPVDGRPAWTAFTPRRVDRAGRRPRRLAV